MVIKLQIMEVTKNPQNHDHAHQNLTQLKRSQLTSRQGDLRISENPKLFQSQLSKLIKILKKPVELRNGPDNQYLSTLIKQHPSLSKLAQQVSVQFVKNLLKQAQLVRPGKNKVIYEKGQQIKSMGIVFVGQLSIISKINPQGVQSPAIQIPNEYIFDKLIEMAKSYTKQLRRKLSIINSTSLKVRRLNSIIEKNFDYFFMDYDKLENDIVQSLINQNQLFGFQDRCLRQTYSHTCVCLSQQTYLLLFKEGNVMVGLQGAFKQKVKKAINQLKTVACFNLLDTEKLSSIIQSMATRKKKRNDIIYRQGANTSHIYLLTQGELKVTKQAHLFQQNPNNLYGDRKKLVEETYLLNNSNQDKAQTNTIKRKVAKSLLPYADFTLMYNFRPMSKNIQIGVITPISLFGQEQYCQKRPRQTNCICSSLEAQYYELSIKKLQQIIGLKFLSDFLEQLKNSVRKKVLYRQSQYGNSIQLQNSKNMNYFYFQDGKQKQSPRKYRISKINDKIQSKKSTPQKKNSSVVPAFTTFNFNRMAKLNLSVPRASKRDLQTQQDSKIEQNPIQMKIMDITHTWQLMKQKVDMQMKTSRKISPVKPTINITKPLIASQFFIRIDKQSKRIEREHRKRIASVGRNIKFGSISQKSPRIQ